MNGLEREEEEPIGLVTDWRIVAGEKEELGMTSRFHSSLGNCMTELSFMEIKNTGREAVWKKKKQTMSSVEHQHS